MKNQNPNQTDFISTDTLDRKWIDVNIPCKAACPIMTDIPGYIQAIMEEDYETAYQINRMDNVLPGVLGRVCDRPCEAVCRHGRDGLGDPVSICFLKRSAADFGMTPPQLSFKSNGKAVCIIGAGPAGLTAANDLALRGYSVMILEQFDEPGGMLRYGIPQFRLPYSVVANDVASILQLGVTLRTNQRVPDERGIQKLATQFDAVILAGGCMLPKKIKLSGIDSKGFYWGLDFMMAANQETLSTSFKKVVVIGGGFTSVDCARMAHRLGAEQVIMAYRRIKDDMYIGKHELEAMEAEGIEFAFLVSPEDLVIRDGSVTGVKFIRNSIEKDRSLKPIPDSEFIMEADAAIFAIGQGAESDLPGTEETRHPDNFFIAGDFRNGASTVIEAAAHGRHIARNVHQFLSGIEGYQDLVHIREIPQTGRERDYDFIPRQPMDEIPLIERREKTREVEIGFSREKALIEARRCYLCHYNFQIDIDRCIYCLACIDVMPVNCIKMAKGFQISPGGDLHYLETHLWSEVQAIVIDNDNCIRCGNCVRACPVECISISKYSLEVAEQPMMATKE
ncbi:FAD-dependent oxidoreductase [candidate division KSB1 bacterium]|nr:FAD-dependent oxidoreductase [candidate division KSB1 bacterium]